MYNTFPAYVLYSVVRYTHKIKKVYVLCVGMSIIWVGTRPTRSIFRMYAFLSVQVPTLGRVAGIV